MVFAGGEFIALGIIFVGIVFVAIMTTYFTVKNSWKTDGGPMFGVGAFCIAASLVFTLISAAQHGHAIKIHKEIAKTFPEYHFTSYDLGRNNWSTVEFDDNGKSCKADILFSQTKNKWFISNKVCA